MKIAFLLYPTSKVKVDEDSSFWIMRELKRREHQVFYFESKHLFWTEGEPYAFLTQAKLDRTKGYLPSSPAKIASPLTSLDCIFIRKEPPFDISYLYALQILNEIKKKVFILNDPQGIALSNEKLLSAVFKRFAPESMVTEDMELAVKFIKKLKSRAVIKPLDEKGGTGIFAAQVADRDLPSRLNEATRSGQLKIMIQRYVPVERYGDKRILILNGKILGAFLRKPSAKDFRANLSVGGTMHRASVSQPDRKLVEAMAPEFVARGLYFVGIDVIGRFLTEVNFTSPAGIPEINYFNKTKLEKEVADFIEWAVRKRSLTYKKRTL